MRLTDAQAKNLNNVARERGLFLLDPNSSRGYSTKIGFVKNEKNRTRFLSAMGMYEFIFEQGQKLFDGFGQEVIP